MENCRGQNSAIIGASEGKISIHSYTDSRHLSSQKTFLNYGSIDTSGLNRGNILIHSAKLDNSGEILSEGYGGEIKIFAPGEYLESSAGRISVDGESGSIEILAGDYFTSGTFSARGERGGHIEIEGDKISLTAAQLNASGSKLGGEVSLKTNSWVSALHLNPYVTIDVHGDIKGGDVTLISPLSIVTQASIQLDGKEKGELSIPSGISQSYNYSTIIDPNSQNEPLLWSSLVSSREEVSLASLWSVWEKNREDSFSDERAMIFPVQDCPPMELEFDDPNHSGTSSTFGDNILVLSGGNVVVTKTGDAFAASNARAAYLFNGTTGALISTFRGSTIYDIVI